MGLAVAQAGYDIRTIQEPLSHSQLATTMTCTHVLNRGGRGVSSPFDAAQPHMPRQPAQLAALPHNR